MRFTYTPFLLWAAACAAFAIPCRANAQSRAAVLNPLEQVTDILAPNPIPEPTLDHPTDRPAPAAVDVSEKLLEKPIYACACGCGVFEVGTATMLPHGQGGMTWLEWDYQDQNHNRAGNHEAPRADNDDKEIRTDFFILGLQYFFDRKWGLQVEVPIDRRHYQFTDGATDWTALGDIRIKGLYTGFFEDQSVGIDFGFKLASGNFTQAHADRDTQLGTGSTDFLLGGYYRTNLSRDGFWNFFSQLETDLPFIIQDNYRPGFEVNGSAGVYYSGFIFHKVTISPVGQFIVSYRTSDGGINSAQPVASGYLRALLSPGIEFDFHPFMLYADVEIPVYQYFKGDQISAQQLFKVIFSYSF